MMWNKRAIGQAGLLCVFVALVQIVYCECAAR